MNALIVWVLLGIFLIAACSNKPAKTVADETAEDGNHLRTIRGAHAEQ